LTARSVKKAALLLMSLDPATAGELLKSVPSDAMAEIAAELACLRAGSPHEEDPAESIQEFSAMLSNRNQVRPERFLETMLSAALGEDQSAQLLTQAQQLAAQKDPFLQIRAARVDDLARALDGESPQVAAVVLAELPPGRSAKLLGMLASEVQSEALRGLVAGSPPPESARMRLAEMVRRRLNEIRSGAARPADDGGKGAQHRKAAVLLRGLETPAREELLTALGEKDAEAAASVREKMILWEDLPILPDRPLQEVLRNSDTRNIALALFEARPQDAAKIRNNLSERAGSLLDEETSLMSKPKPEEIREARESILSRIREKNDAGELDFEEAA
jgi:flagellar motor switch protein FliG